jgi:hypothetical protein
LEEGIEFWNRSKKYPHTFGVGFYEAKNNIDEQIEKRDKWKSEIFFWKQFKVYRKLKLN